MKELRIVQKKFPEKILFHSYRTFEQNKVDKYVPPCDVLEVLVREWDTPLCVHKNMLSLSSL